jgi:parvulin-like peptidyl-prolyl isomerase
MKPPKVLFFLASLCLLAGSSRAEVLERIVAKVNGEIITLSDFQSRQIAALREARIPAERQEAYLRENGRRLLDEAIDDLLIAQKAEEVGKEVPEEYLKQIIDGIKKDYNLPSDEAFEEQIRREGFTLAEIKHNISRSLLTRRYIADEVEKKVTVSDAELRAEYEARKAANYTAPASDHLQEILVSSKEPNAEALARDIVARVRAGEDFAKLARAHSSAPSRDSGGDLGKVARRDMNAALAAVVSQLAPGEVSEPMAARGGYRIVRVAARDEGKVTPFDDVKEALRESMLDRRHVEEMNRLAKRLREHAIIQDMVREVPLAVVQADEATEAKPSILDAVGNVAPEAQASPAPDEEFVTKRGQVRKIAPAGSPQEGTPSDAEPPQTTTPAAPRP